MLYPAKFGNNPFFPSTTDFRIVHFDDDSGSGVVTYRAYMPGELIAVFNGDLVTEITQHSLQVEPGLHLVDLFFVGYFLHSCEPNVVVDMQTRQVHAVAPIYPLDFLRMDYASTEEALFSQFPCHCGSKQCRRWITGRQETPHEQDPRYLAAFGPLETVQ
ncbi:MAG: hypothetical protein ACI9G1_004435 [Pirellulaceae bacterium]|jgi:hypothetical protein